jgi:hypothetical protein
VVLSGTYDIPTLGVKSESVEGNRSRLKGEPWRELEAVDEALTASLAAKR